jgi:Ca2+-binding EF-hand superfamily protein
MGLSLAIAAATAVTANAQLLEKPPVKSKEKAAVGANANRDAKAAGQPNAAAPQSNAMFSAIDADGDGVISKVELRKAIKALMSLDADKDGSITLAEAGGGAAAPVGIAEDPQVAQLMTYDKNGDGKLSVNEVPNNMRNALRGADQNHDNMIDRQELAAVVAATRTQFGNNGAPWAGANNGAAQQATGQFLQHDRNGDGRLSADELRNLPPQMSRSLQNADRNKDGAIDAGELQAAIEQMGDRAKALRGGIDPAKGRGFADRNGKNGNANN